MDLKASGWSLIEVSGCRALEKERQVAERKEISLDP